MPKTDLLSSETTNSPSRISDERDEHGAYSKKLFHNDCYPTNLREAVERFWESSNSSSHYQQLDSAVSAPKVMTSSSADERKVTSTPLMDREFCDNTEVELTVSCRDLPENDEEKGVFCVIYSRKQNDKSVGGELNDVEMKMQDDSDIEGRDDKEEMSEYRSRNRPEPSFTNGIELGRTEILSRCRNPFFKRRFLCFYSSKETHFITILVYSVLDNIDNQPGDTSSSSQKLLGCATFCLDQVVRNRGASGVATEKGGAVYLTAEKPISHIGGRQFTKAVSY